MNVFLKKLFIVLLCFVLMLSIASCSLFDPREGGLHEWREDCCPVPEGYTGGVDPNLESHHSGEVKWLETYDELLSAVALLKSHGTEFYGTRFERLDLMFFNCEEYGIDIKFCISFERHSAEKLKEGQDFFDRTIPRVHIVSYVFFEDVSIEKLEYSMVHNYNSLVLDQNPSIYRKQIDPENINIRQEVIDPQVDSNYIQRYTFCHGEDRILNLKYQFHAEKGQNSALTEEQLEILKESFTIIYLND